MPRATIWTSPSRLSIYGATDRSRSVTVAGWAQIVIFIAVLTALTPLLGGYMSKVYQGQGVALSPLAAPVERLTYQILRVEPRDGQDWRTYARAVLTFSLGSWLVLYAVLRTQG